MSLFEIELNGNFFFKNLSPFLTEIDFHKFYTLNNIYTNNKINEFKLF